MRVEVLKRGGGEQGGSQSRRSQTWMKAGQQEGQRSLREDKLWEVKEDRRWQEKAQDKEKGR